VSEALKGGLQSKTGFEIFALLSFKAGGCAREIEK
jgi:hypothetical protein